MIIETMRKKAMKAADEYLEFCKENKTMNESEFAELETIILGVKDKVEACDDLGDLLFTSSLLHNLAELTEDSDNDFVPAGKKIDIPQLADKS